MPLLLILILVPLIEIALFVIVGGRIGVWPVLALVALGALVGVLLLRGRLARLPRLIEAGRDPAQLLAAGMLTALGALLLILPGFLTDAIGLVLMLPPLQALVGRWLSRNVARAERPQGPHPGARARGDVIEGEFTEMPSDGETGPDRDRNGDRTDGQRLTDRRHGDERSGH